MLYVTVFTANLVFVSCLLFDLPKGISLAALAPNIVDVTCLSRSLSSAVWSKFSISSASAIIEFAFVSDFRIRIRLRTLIASATSFDSSVFCVALIAAEGWLLPMNCLQTTTKHCCQIFHPAKVLVPTELFCGNLANFIPLELFWESLFSI